MGPLVDTSVLIDYFGGVTNRESDLLDGLLAEGTAPATAPIIVQEFLQGFNRPRHFEAARAHLALFTKLPPPDYSLHEQAAGLHLALKRRGDTIPTVDALIVVIARAAGCELLTRDGHQQRLAKAADVALT